MFSANDASPHTGFAAAYFAHPLVPAAISSLSAIYFSSMSVSTVNQPINQPIDKSRNQYHYSGRSVVLLPPPCPSGL